jgi:DNA repair protein RecO (recombination protein O)
MKLFATKGLVLRSTKYGETSLIVLVYTALFGLQSYLVNGVRIASKKGNGRANLLQPGCMLHFIVYHNDLKNLQRIKEFKWSYIYQHILSSVLKNSVALFMVELLQKTIQQPEPNPALFEFIEDTFIHLDTSDPAVVANYPLYFSLQLSSFLGFGLTDDYDAQHTCLDLKEGKFVEEHPHHPYFLTDPFSKTTAQFLSVTEPRQLASIELNQQSRRVLLQAYQNFYALHIQDFTILKSIAVLQEVL